MSDLDEEDEDFGFTKFGTALPEIEDDTETKKPIAIHEQIATDSQGRRRFHGAFTGGFSAGYYNTVSTKDGWTPASFRSSRSDRKEKRKMEPEDFMDEEDTSEFGIAPKRIVTQSLFSSEKSDSKMLNADKFSKNATMILGMNMLQTLIIPVSNNIGIKLLRRMGWKPGQGIGPRVKRRKIQEDEYIPENMTFPPEDTVQIDFTAKDNINGLGYTGLDPKLALHDKVKKSSAISLKTKAGMKLSFTGQAFGVGAYEEEEEDIYAQDSMANYDLIMDDEKRDNTYGWSKPTKAIAGQKNPAIAYMREVLEGYHKVIKPIRRKSFPPPLLPPDFDPKKRLRLKSMNQNSQDEPEDSSSVDDNSDKFHRPDPDENRKLLGKEKMLHKKEIVSNKSVFTFINPEDCQRLKKIKSDISQAKSIVDLLKPKKPQVYEPFSADSAKQSRYQQYMSALRAKKTDPYSHVKHDLEMTEWEKHQEQEEFQKSSRFFQPLSATMASRFTNESDELREQDEKENSLRKAASMKMFGFMTREDFEWHPDSLLCKRFNVPNPYTNSDFVGIRKESTSSKGMFLDPSDFEKKAAPEILPEDNGIDPKTSTGKIISDSLIPLRSKGERQPKVGSRWDEEPPVQGPELAPANGGDEELTTQELDPVSSEEPKTTDATEENEDSESEQTTKERPSLDIFKAIFESSDENESEEEIASENEEDIQAVSDLQQGKLNEPSIPRHIFHVKKVEQKGTPTPTTTLDSSSATSEAETFGPALPPPNILMKQAEMIYQSKKAKKAKKHKKGKHKKKK